MIATRNRKNRLLRTLAHLSALPERPRIVVVDNASDDETSAAVRCGHPDVQLVRLERNVGAAARTVGVRALENEVVAFSDDDSWWAPGALARAARLFDVNPRLGLIAARILVGPQGKLDPTCLEMAHSPIPAVPGLPGPPVLGFLACAAIVRRDAYLEVGGFEPRFGVGAEEHLLALDLAAAGWTLAYVDDVIAYHHPSPGLPGRENRRSAELRNLIWTAWLRRPALLALSLSGSLFATGIRERRPRALLEAARGLPWVLRERRPLPRDVERAARRLSGH